MFLPSLVLCVSFQADSSLGTIDMGDVIEVKQTQARNGYGFDIKVRKFNFVDKLRASQFYWPG